MTCRNQMFEQFTVLDSLNLIDYEYSTYQPVVRLELQIYFKWNKIRLFLYILMYFSLTAGVESIK